MASEWSTRVKKVNYAKLNSVATTSQIHDESYEEGQLADSPLTLVASEDEMFQAEQAESMSNLDSCCNREVDDTSSQLDYEDDVASHDAVSVSSTLTLNSSCRTYGGSG